MSDNEDIKHEDCIDSIFSFLKMTEIDKSNNKQWEDYLHSITKESVEINPQMFLKDSIKFLKLLGIQDLDNVDLDYLLTLLNMLYMENVSLIEDSTNSIYPSQIGDTKFKHFPYSDIFSNKLKDCFHIPIKEGLEGKIISLPNGKKGFNLSSGEYDILDRILGMNTSVFNNERIDKMKDMDSTENDIQDSDYNVACNNTNQHVNEECTGELMSEGLAPINFSPLSEVHYLYEEARELLSRRSMWDFNEMREKLLRLELNLAIAEDEIRIMTAKRARNLNMQIIDLLKEPKK